ncbi:MAG TPA: crotonase/enoyl-CoA hydratase family protein [Alphaproteobacteria bacterium]|jgi:enoyl-CoA hydratase/carnithine racemase
MSKVLVEKANRIATVTINAPESRNTMTDAAMIEALLKALEDVDADRGISVMILTGAGTAFSAGGDVKAMANRSGMFAGAPLDIAEGYRTGVQRIPKALYGLDVPSIAAVNGPAVGAGCDLAFMCDLRLASSTAQFGEVFVNLGIIPGDAGSWFLPRRIGYQIAAEMTFTGRLVGAEEALAKGLVLKVVPPEKLMAEAKALAAVIASKPPRAVRQAKRLLRAGEAMDLANFLEMAAANQALAHTTADHIEAVKAFVEKRKPEFKGR